MEHLLFQLIRHKTNSNILPSDVMHEIRAGCEIIRDLIRDLKLVPDDTNILVERNNFNTIHDEILELFKMKLNAIKSLDIKNTQNIDLDGVNFNLYFNVDINTDLNNNNL